MYTEQNPQKAILPRQRVMTSSTSDATGLDFQNIKQMISENA